MTPLIVKRYNDENVIAQMYQAGECGDAAIVDDFTEILDKIIVDVYLKDNVFSSKQPDDLSDEDKAVFVLHKRKELLDRMAQKEFEFMDYIHSPETTFKMTACVKCNCLGIRDEAYEKWREEHPQDAYCEVCMETQDDFVKF